MPIYLLKCPNCGEVSEKHIPYSALKNQRCAKCKTKVDSLLLYSKVRDSTKLIRNNIRIPKMSCDNHIVMLQTQDGFRVSEVQAVENLLNGEDWNEEMVYTTFRNAKVQPDYISAEGIAKKLVQKTSLTPGWVELTFADRNFPTSESPKKELPKIPQIEW